MPYVAETQMDWENAIKFDVKVTQLLQLTTSDQQCK